MTKNQMIEKMQLLEAAAWLKFRTAHASMGQDHSITNRYRAAWCAVSSVLDEVGVAANQQLPDNLAALSICLREAEAKRTAEA